MASSSLFINMESLVTTTFENALKSEDVIFQGSKTVEQLIDGCPYQVRYVPGLSKKPNIEDSQASDKDPLAPPYKKDIHVCDLPSDGLNTMTYAVILNKYAVTQNHFLLLPHEFMKQSDPLSADELSLTYRIIKNYKSKVFAFFNCGEESGASQKHKHIQFFPVSDNEPPIDVFLRGQNYDGEPSQLVQVPWAHFLVSIHPPEQVDQLGNYLMEKFIQLLDKMFDFKRGKDLEGATASYNIIIMENSLHVIPRSRKDFILANDSKVLLGGINYAGIIIVRQEDDLDETKNAGITNILLSAGLNKDE